MSLTAKGILKFIKRHLVLSISITLGLPFMLIPAVVLLLRIEILINNLFIPYKSILQINMSETVTLSTFIYYYTCTNSRNE